jgi:hypothetical protein
MKLTVGAAIAMGVLAGMALASCSSDNSAPAVDDGGADGSTDGVAPDGQEGEPGDGASGDARVAKPARFLFAKTIPAAAGPIVALPGGGWAVFVEILHSTTIAGTVITRSGRDDAALVKLDANGDPVWARPMIGPGDDNRASLAVDELGNLYVAGLSISGTSMSFGGGITTSSPSAANAQWGWYAKFDPNGTPQWAESVGSTLGVANVQIAARNGKVAVSGYYSEPGFRYIGTSGVVAAPAFGNYPVFVLSCNASDGLATSLARLDGASGVSGLVVDSTGRAIVTGYFGNPKLTKEPTGDVVARVGTGSNSYAVAFDTAGAVLWSRAFGSTGADAGLGVTATGLAADGNGHVVVGGTFGAPVDFGGGVRGVLGPSDPFLLSLNPATGATVWDKELATSTDDGFGYVALDPTGNVVTMGSLAAAPTPTSIDGVAMPTTPGTFVAKLSPAPTLAWVRHATILPPAAAYISSLAANGSGQVAVTGTVHGTIDLGGGAIEPSDSGFEDMFVLGVADPN